MADLRTRPRINVVSTLVAHASALASALASAFALVATLVAPPAGAQGRLTAADSQLIVRLLVAEERRDTSAAAYADGMRHADARMQMIARRGLLRSRDPLFAQRDSFPPVPAPPAYADPAWRLRFRALGRTNSNCDQLHAALTDSTWQVRLRGADLVTAACASDARIAGIIRDWVRDVPGTTSRRSGDVSWHAAAHGITTLARTAPAEARAALPRFATSAIPALRIYAARAAATLNDTASLRRLAVDADDNVKESAIDGLARVAAHEADDVYIAALPSSGIQVVRAAANALKGSPRGAAVLEASIAAAGRLRRDSSETSRRVRAAVAARVAEFARAADWPNIAPLASDFDCRIADAYAAIGVALGAARATPSCAPMPISIPADAVRLALGADVRLRVVMAESSGGGSFVVRLRGDVAPVMAARVLTLARAGWYDGNPWHRVEADFVIQGGAPGANEYRGFPRFFRDELGTVQHLRGTVGMSTGEHDTGDAQWFVNLRDNLRLNRDYTVFAEVVEGIDVVDGILEGDVIARIEVVGGR